LEKWYENQADYERLCHVLFLKSTLYYKQNNIEQATMCCKTAEKYFGSLNEENDYIKGPIYQRLARCSEADFKPQKAVEYFLLAVPIHKKYKDSLQIIGCYAPIPELIAAYQHPIDTPLLISFYDSASTYLYTKRRTFESSYIKYSKAELLNDTATMIEELKYLCDTLKIARSALFLFSNSLEKNKLDSAYYYLNILAQDTLVGNSNIGLMTYYKSSAEYYYAAGDYRKAADIYRKLYLDLKEKGKSDNTQDIINAYDKQRLTEQKQHQEQINDKQRIIIVLVVLLLLTSISLFVAIFKTSQKQHRIELMKREEKQHLLEHDKQQLSAFLAETIRNKVKLTEGYYAEQLKLKNQDMELPEWARWFINVNLMDDIRQGHSLRKEINYIYNNILDRLSRDYHALTEVDLLEISLILLKIDGNERTILLGRNTQTTYNRRAKLKERLNVQAVSDFDEALRQWLLDYASA
jgi:hypothetical protein